MLPIRYERHLLTNSHLPFIFHTDTIEYSKGSYSNWHDNTEFLYCIKGIGVVHSDNKTIVMKEGDTVVINARCLHYITSPSSVTYRCLIIDNSYFHDNGFDITKLKFIPNFTDTKAGELMQEIHETFENQTLTYRIAQIRLSVLNYLLHVCRSYMKVSTTDSGGKISKSHEAILKAVEFIDNNYEKHLSIDEIAAVAGFSKFHFSRLFKNYTGFTVVEHINGRRCENAKIMLENETKSIADIASECGFESSSYFAKAFEKAFGVLPSAYRKTVTQI